MTTNKLRPGAFVHIKVGFVRKYDLPRVNKTQNNSENQNENQFNSPFAIDLLSSADVVGTRKVAQLVDVHSGKDQLLGDKYLSQIDAECA